MTGALVTATVAIKSAAPFLPYVAPLSNDMMGVLVVSAVTLGVNSEDLVRVGSPLECVDLSLLGAGLTDALEFV